LVDVILYMRHGTPHPPHPTRSGGLVRVSSVFFSKTEGGPFERTDEGEERQEEGREEYRLGVVIYEINKRKREA